MLGSPVWAVNTNIVINAPEPAPQYDQNATQFDLYYAGGAFATPSPGYIDSEVGYRWHNTSADNAENLILIDVQLVKQNAFALSGSERIAVSLSVNSSQGTEIPLAGAGIRSGNSVPAVCIAASNCQSADNLGEYYAARYTVNSILRLAVSLAKICSLTGATGTLCASNAFRTLGQSGPEMLVQNLTIHFNKLADDSVVRVNANQQGNESRSFNLYVSSVAPTSNCQTAAEANLYFPGDQSVLFNIAALGLSANGGPPVQNIVFLGKKGAPPIDPSAGLLASSGNTIARTSADSTTALITGLVNSTSVSDTGYQARIHAQNRAGIVSDVASTTQTCTPSFEIKPQPISGILTESKCFIATAAYHDGKAPPVMMLRKFRDQILARSTWGRRFIAWYYRWSPRAAEWAWDKPWVRALSRKILTPIEITAWVWLKLFPAAEAQESSSTYLDRVKKNLESTPVSSESYSEQEKKKLLQEEPVPESSEGYTEREKAKLTQEPDEPGVEPDHHLSYTEKLKPSLPPPERRQNPSELVKRGLDRKLGRGEVPPIKYAASFRMGISPGMSVRVDGAEALNTFENIYGSGWQPEMLFHIERQLFHSENLGSLGLTGDFGLTYAEGFGRLRFVFNETTISRTRFSFVQVPILLGANYRFNLFRILRPYVGAGAGTLLYTEIRQDTQPDRRGYSWIYNIHGGVALLMDFLDGSSARDSFLTMGIQHTYLFAEYFFLNTLAGNVRFARAGLYSGFMFEF